MDVAKLLDPFRLAPHGKIVITNLQESRLIGQLQLSRRDLLQHLDHERKFAALGFAEKKTDVLRHDDVARNETSVPAANALQLMFERIPGGHGIQEPHAVVAAEGNEVQAALALVAHWFDVHSCRL